MALASKVSWSKLLVATPKPLRQFMQVLEKNLLDAWIQNEIQ
jgi:hypothetical protein